MHDAVMIMSKGEKGRLKIQCTFFFGGGRGVKHPVVYKQLNKNRKGTISKQLLKLVSRSVAANLFSHLQTFKLLYENCTTFVHHKTL